MGPSPAKGADEDQRWLQAEKRHAVLRALSRKPRLTVADVEDACKSLSVSRGRFYQLLQAFQKDPHVSTMVAKKRGRSTGEGALPLELEEIIRRLIAERYLTPQKLSISKLLQEIAVECAKIGVTRPSRKAVSARIAAIDQRDLLKAREGTKRADDHAGPAQGRCDR